MPKHSTSWQGVSFWYNKTVGDDGHYYHQHVVLPNALRLLGFPATSSAAVLDLACGQGVLERSLPKTVSYLGVDIAKDLIAFAKEKKAVPEHQFLAGDVSKPLTLPSASFTHTACILAIQNIRHPAGVCANAAAALQPGGKFLIVLNHPCFRIPRQSSWGIDEKTKTQFRRLDRYLSPMEIPITAHPGKKASQVTWSFHLPLSAYATLLRESGFVIEAMEEWGSDKVSQGKAAKMENRSRSEFPLFLAILARKHLSTK